MAHTFKFRIFDRFEAKFGHNASVFGLDEEFSHGHPGLNLLVFESLRFIFICIFTGLVLGGSNEHALLLWWRTLRLPVVVHEL